MAKKANPRIVVQKNFNRMWMVSVRLSGKELRVCDPGQGPNTWMRHGDAMKAAERVRERLAGHDWSKCPIEVEE